MSQPQSETPSESAPASPAAPEAVAAPARRRRGPRALAGIVAVAIVAVIAVVGLVGVVQGRIHLPLGSDSEAVEQTRPVPSVIPEAIPIADVATPNPQSCAAIFTDRMWTRLSQFTLNSPDAPLKHGSADPALSAVLTQTPGLNCSFGTQPNRTIATTVVRITDDQQTAALARLGAMGANCAAYEEGQRCLLQGTGDHGSTGETHIFREGVWIASAWVEYSPSGYSAAILQTLFPN